MYKNYLAAGLGLQTLGDDETEAYAFEDARRSLCSIGMPRVSSQCRVGVKPV